jgi:DNA-binding transcriptional LysR family regulator
MERLRTFCAIVEAGSMVAAARSDPTRQSQFSRQIKELERALGVQLFKKVGKTLQLTDMGRHLALSTEAFLRSLDQLASPTKAKPEVVRIGGTESVLRWLVLPRLATLMGGPEGLRIELRTFPTESALRAAHEGVVDLAVVRDDAPDDGDAVLPAGALEHRLVVARRLLPGKSAAGMQLMRSIPFAMLTGEGQLVREVNEFGREAGWEMEVQLRVENFTLLVEACSHMDLAAVIPAPALAQLSQERYAVIAPPQGPLLRRKLAIAYEPRAAEFRGVIKRTAQRLSRLMSEISNSP